MDLLSSRPFAPIQDGLPANFPAATGDLACEVVVIGAGITSALVAWHLADAGIDVIVIDRREVAHGSTAGNTGFLQYELDEPLHRLMQRFDPEFAMRAYRRCQAAIGSTARLVSRLRIDCAFEKRPSLFLARNRTHLPALRREFEARQRAGLAVEWWPRSRVAAESTLPHPAAIRSQDAAQVDAYRLTYGLLVAAQRAGARVFDRTAITTKQFRARGVVLRTSRGGRVRARHMVVATGYEAGKFLPEKVTELHSTYALVTEPVPNFSGWPEDRCLIWETGRPYVYLRTTADNRCLMGGYDEPFRDPAARDRLLKTKTALLKRRFGQLFPRIPIEVASSWAGTFSFTPSGLPVIGRHSRVPHTWFALGYGGNGTVFSVIAAEIIREALQGRTDPDAELFDFARSGGL